MPVVMVTKQGEVLTILKKRKSRTSPFFEIFYLYDILWKDQIISIRCNELYNLINGKTVTLVFD